MSIYITSYQFIFLLIHPVTNPPNTSSIHTRTYIHKWHPRIGPNHIRTHTYCSPPTHSPTHNHAHSQTHTYLRSYISILISVNKLTSHSAKIRRTSARIQKLNRKILFFVLSAASKLWVHETAQKLSALLRFIRTERARVLMATDTQFWWIGSGPPCNTATHPAAHRVTPSKPSKRSGSASISLDNTCR